MFQAATRYWNEIAKKEALDQPWATIFAMDREAMGKALEQIESPMESQGVPNAVILAWRLVCPLLQENKAISQYITDTGQTSLRKAMPELTTVKEAVMMASQEYRLTPSQQEQLAQLLRQSLTQPATVKPS